MSILFLSYLQITVVVLQSSLPKGAYTFNECAVNAFSVTFHNQPLCFNLHAATSTFVDVYLSLTITTNIRTGFNENAKVAILNDTYDSIFAHQYSTFRLINKYIYRDTLYIQLYYIFIHM